MSSALNGKVDKVDGKGLSTNDYDNTEKGKVADNTTARHTHSNKSVLDSTTASYTIDEKTKLSGIESGAEANIIETVKVNGTALIPSSKAVDVTVPTKVSDLTNDSGYTTNIGTITGITMNSESKGTSGTVDLGTVITAHQDITGKEDKSNKITSMTSSSTDTQYPSAKAVYDELEDLKEENSELKQRIEDEENNQLINTASGTNLNINDTASYPIREIQVKGNSIQDGTPTPSNQVPINSAGDNGMGSINEVISNSDNTQGQNYTIPCQQPMRSIGNVRDEFVKIDGVWYEKHVIGQVVLNGSESGWLERGNTSENYIKFRNANALPYDSKGDLLLISDYFVTNIGANNASYSGNAICGNSGNYAKWLHISIDNTIVNSVETFKTWLSTHNTEVIYELAEPIYLECTEEQITALEAIEKARTYKKTTNVFSEDITPAYITITYVRDLESAILSYIDASVNQAIGGAY